MPNQVEPTEQQRISYQFISLVMQTGNMAMMFLGKLAHPETGKAVTDLDTARMFIDQLEMLSVKTKGNLDQNEQKVLNDSLTSLRLMFVETANEAKSTDGSSEAKSDPQLETAPPVEPKEMEQAGTGPAEDGDSRKKFVKKY